MQGMTADEAKPKGPPFVKFYDGGLDRIESLLTLKGGPTVGRLWLWLVKHAGHDNAVVVTRELLAEELGIHPKSVTRAALALQAGGAIAIAKIGTANAYILNHGEVWKTYEDHKRFCGFTARAIVGFKDNKGLRARLSHFSKQPSLLDIET